jgi:heme exporter protein CcmD
MPDWLNHPHAGYVLAAYSGAAVMLVALAGLSWRESRRRAKEWQQIQQARSDRDQ